MKKSLFLHTLTSWTLSLSLGLGFMAHVGCANAQLGNFPSRPIKIIVPFVPGGTLDSVARLLAKHLTESLPQAVIVDNKGGGGGIVGVDYVAKSAPDGYTLVFNAATPMVTVVSLQKTPYDVSKDLAALNQVATFDYILAVNANTCTWNWPKVQQVFNCKTSLSKAMVRPCNRYWRLRSIACLTLLRFCPWCSRTA